ncbi:hypothetical protein [Nannocystis pusilla]|uniref:hypothetical protein n=1 Tax=Nannocystis pusilla TaxID=889268 RepID=UPI003B78BC41
MFPKTSQREQSAGHAWVFEGPGAEPKRQEIAAVEAAGYTVIDLSNSWVPYIFSEKTVAVDDAQPNDYRKRYVDLANNRVDADGEALDKHERNFLELYGIPPTLQVVAGEWRAVDGEIGPCLQAAGFDPEVLRAWTGGGIAYADKKTGDARKLARLKASLEKDLKKAKLDPADLEQAKGHPSSAAPTTTGGRCRARSTSSTTPSVGSAARRCSSRPRARAPTPRASSTRRPPTRWRSSRRSTRSWAGATSRARTSRPSRARRTRAPTAGCCGSSRSASSRARRSSRTAAPRWKPKFRWKDRRGEEQPLRDVVRESVDAAVAALDLGTPESARRQLDKLSELGAGNFEDLLVAVKLPPRPDYYLEDMTYEVVIDRGDVWYDFPFDSTGKRLSQPRERYPHITVYTVYEGQKIPLIHWRTTIGSWRSELYNGGEYYKYKDSDVGPRVWKEIVAAPVWIPPATTPPRELVRRKWKDGRVRTVVNNAEFGPSYTSAYGLVAAYHIKEIKNPDGTLKADFDNSIRTHGSVDYMSILRRYSHGCHRLYNMSAVRLFSFILGHRQFVREGQIKLGFSREFVHEDQTFKISLKTRGYRYKLAQPIAVDVTEGRIKGTRQKPIEGYIPKPSDTPAPADGPAAEAAPGPAEAAAPAENNVQSPS